MSDKKDDKTKSGVLLFFSFLLVMTVVVVSIFGFMKYSTDYIPEGHYYVNMPGKVSYVSESASNMLYAAFTTSNTNEIVLCLFGEINDTGLFVENVSFPEFTDIRNGTSASYNPDDCEAKEDFLGVIHNHPGMSQEWCAWSLSSTDIKYQKNNQVIGITCPPYQNVHFLTERNYRGLQLYDFDLKWWDNEGAIFSE